MKASATPVEPALSMATLIMYENVTIITDDNLYGVYGDVITYSHFTSSTHTVCTLGSVALEMGLATWHNLQIRSLKKKSRKLERR